MASLSRYFLYEWLEPAGTHRRYLQLAYDAAEDLAGKRRSSFSPVGREILLCGVGRTATAEYFCERLNRTTPSAKVTLFDLRPAALQKTARKVARRDFRLRIDSRAGDALAMPFAGETFDWIETDHFLQFIRPDQLSSLVSEWRRVLKPGGRITTRFFTPDLTRSRERRRATTWRMMSRVISAPCHLHSTDQIIAALEQEKFSVFAEPIPHRNYQHITSLVAFKSPDKASAPSGVRRFRKEMQPAG